MANVVEEAVARSWAISEQDYLACSRCGACSYACPVYRVKPIQSFSPRGRVALSRAVSLGQLELGEGFARRFYDCTLCAACSEVCPSGMKVDALLQRVRQELVEPNLLPATLARLSETILEHHNISGDDNALRLVWTENLPEPSSVAGKTGAPVVYFVGCVSSFFPRAYSMAQAFVQTLLAAGVEYMLLGGEEWCCGYPLLASGLVDEAIQMMLHNIARVEAVGAQRVVFTCPSCYHMWKHAYPQISGEHTQSLEMLHATEYLAELIGEGRIPLRSMTQTVVYHDPCDLGRKSKVYEAPRQVLCSIPGVTLVEMPDNRESALCCGGGGNLESYDPDLAGALSARRLAQAEQTGAQVIVSACQQCERTLSNACRQQKARMRVLDVTEIVWEAVQK